MTAVTLTLADMRKLVTLAGFTPAAGSWEDDDRIFAFSVESVPETMGHPRFAIQYDKATGELLRDNRPYYPGGRGPESVTTEDLAATCQNYPESIDARVAAIVLERRVGLNQWTAAVARRLAEGKPPGPCKCKWWLNCTRPATMTREHPTIGKVPICAECNAKVGRLEAVSGGVSRGPT